MFHFVLMRVELRIKGGGLSGWGYLLPENDIRGIRFGCGARKMLAEFSHSSYPPMEWSEYDSWKAFPSPNPPNQRKILSRLLDAGLIWGVSRFHQSTKGFSDTKPDYCVALTDLGQKVLDVFGDDIRTGQRVRWQKWRHPSVKCTDKLWEDLLAEMTNDGILSDLALSGRDLEKMERSFGLGAHSERIKCQQYGNSQNYLIRRIKRFDSMWGDVWMAPFAYG